MCCSKKIVLCSIVFTIFFCFNESADKKTAVRPADGGFVFPDDFAYRSGVDLESNQFRRNHPGDDDYEYEMEGNGHSKADSKLKPKEIYTNTSDIPISLIREINNKEYSINDLLLHYVDDYDGDFLENRFGDAKAGVKIASEAKCMPELRTVTLVEKKDPSILYIPSCTRIERCGGCCNHDLLECQPEEFETINLQVYRGSYKGGNNFKYDGKEIVSVDRHKSCKCDCKVKESDCVASQVYEKDKCRCRCRNTDEEKKCLKENSTKLWNPNTCACQCRQELMCTTGSLFDWRQCKCVVKQLRRRNAEQHRRNIYRYQILPVIPLRTDD